jgi:hypothetical protein
MPIRPSTIATTDDDDPHAETLDVRLADIDSRLAALEAAAKDSESPSS